MYFHLRTKCTKWLPSPYVIISMVVYLFIWEWHPPLRPWRWWAALAVIAARSAKTRAPDYRLCEDEIYNKERKWDLMESMIDGSFKWRGPALLFLLNSLATNSSPPPPHLASSCGLGPAVYLTVHLREGLTEVKPMGGGTRGEGLAGCLCCAVAGRPLRDSARLRRGETRQGLRGGLMPCNED